MRAVLLHLVVEYFDSLVSFRVLSQGKVLFTPVSTRYWCLDGESRSVGDGRRSKDGGRKYRGDRSRLK